MKRFAAFFLTAMLLLGGASPYAQASSAQKSPKFQYATMTEANKDLFDVKQYQLDRLSEYYTHAVLISPENYKELAVRAEASSGLMRDDPQYAAIRGAAKKREENNKKLNPFYEKSTSYVRFPTLKLKSGKQGIPAHIAGSNHMTIFTKPDGGKWTVKKGQTLTIKYELDISIYDTTITKISALTSSVGYIKNGKMYELGKVKGQSIDQKFTIPVSGEVEFYIIPKSYIAQIVANGSIQVVDAAS